MAILVSSMPCIPQPPMVTGRTTPIVPQYIPQLPFPLTIMLLLVLHAVCFNTHVLMYVLPSDPQTGSRSNVHAPLHRHVIIPVASFTTHRPYGLRITSVKVRTNMNVVSKTATKSLTNCVLEQHLSRKIKIVINSDVSCDVTFCY